MININTMGDWSHGVKEYVLGVDEGRCNQRSKIGFFRGEIVVEFGKVR